MFDISISKSSVKADYKLSQAIKEDAMSPFLELYIILEKNVPIRNQLLKEIGEGRINIDIPPREKDRQWGYLKGMIIQRYWNMAEHLRTTASDTDRRSAEEIVQKIIIEDIEKMRRVFYGEAPINILNNNRFL